MPPQNFLNKIWNDKFNINSNQKCLYVDKLYKQCLKYFLYNKLLKIFCNLLLNYK